MSTDITDKVYCLVTQKTGRYWLTKKRRDAILAIINPDNPGQNVPRYLDIDDNTVAVIDIVGIVKGSQIAELERGRKGDYKCKWDFWHERNTTCGHGQLSKEERERYKRAET